MERPPSAVSSSLPSAGGTHKRGQSIANVPKHNIVSLFVRNVRLLDLDRLPDWPRVTPASLHQDARTRIRGAEWCLYQLFRLYDTATTTEKLQPFFPPLEPLQSINLRAALFRCLNDLKKNGVLGKDIVLRKSMLDDCQGDKFWELCLSFSAIVMRKVRADKRDNGHHSTARTIGNAQSLTHSQRESMLPLAVAHKAALTRILAKKARRKHTYSRLYDVFLDKEKDLRERVMLARQHGAEQAQEPDLAKEVLEKDWIGTNELRDALRDGDQAAGGDNIVTRSFDSVWKANEKDLLFKPSAEETGILEDLEHRAHYQARRLQRWQMFHERLLSLKPPPSRGSESSSRSSQLRFDQHQNLTIRDVVDNQQPLPTQPKHQKHDSVMKYDEILTAMREELRKNSAAPRSEPTPKPEPTEPESIARSGTPSYRRPSAQDTFAASLDHHHRSHSQTAVPVRPRMGRRVSSRSRSYQQPKVISQREPIPFKSELFSPLKTRRTSTSPASSGRISVLASPIEEPSSGEQGQIEAVISSASRSVSLNGDYDGSGAATSELNSQSARGSGASTPRSARSVGENPDSGVEFSSKASTLGVTSRTMDNYGRTMRPSLADRTRMSMAFKSSDDIATPPTEVIGSHHGSVDSMEVHSSKHLSDPTLASLGRRPTLHDRTRQSISSVPTHSTAVPLKLKKPTHTRSQTAAYPVNQFETPQKPHTLRRSTLTLDAASSPTSSSITTAPPLDQDPILQKRSITPREKLFDEDAEYASIFKARPKVALSPVMSPSPYQDSFPADATAPLSDDVLGTDSPLHGK